MDLKPGDFAIYIDGNSIFYNRIYLITKIDGPKRIKCREIPTGVKISGYGDNYEYTFSGTLRKISEDDLWK